MTAATAAATAMHTAPDFTVLGLYSQADFFVKGVMILLLIMSVVTWAILLSKYKMFRSLRSRARDFEEAFWTNRGLEELYKGAKPEDADHPMASLYVVGLREWERAKEQEDDENSIFQVGVIDRIRQMIIAKMNRELERIEGTLPVLATVGSTAPFIGLLGTVWGIMNSFQSIGASKNTSLAVVAPGIAEALLATALGLFAAIPAVVAYNKLSVELGRYAGRLDAFVSEFLAILERQQQEDRVNVKKRKTKLKDAS